MPIPVRLKSDDDVWTAEVDGEAVHLRDVAGTFAVRRIAPGRWRVESGAPAASALDGVAAVSGDAVWVSLAGELMVFDIVTDARPARAASRAQDALTPPMSATVVRVNVKPGERVAAGDTLVVLEAMKMELAIRAPDDGTVKAVNCAVGDLVQPGVALVEF